MSKFDCARCDWTPDRDADDHPQQQLADHAASAGHWLCGCCALSLSDDQSHWQACETCLSTSRALLSGIVTMWLDLPSHLGHLKGAVYDSDRPSAADGRPLPGGDVLVLLGPGGSGVSEDAQTWRENDSPSVAFSLLQHEDDWRHTRGEPASDLPPSSSAKVVDAAARYLDTFTRWAAQHHPAFAEYLTDLRSLHARLERATATQADEIRSKVECLECGALLRREGRKGDACEHTPPAALPEREWVKGKWVEGEWAEGHWVRLRSAADVQRIHAADLKTWEAEHATCDQGGLRDDWTCPRPSCGERYDAARFALAASGPAKERLREHWVTVEQAAKLLSVPADTVRKWERRGHVRSDRTVSSEGRLMVWYADVEQRRMQQEAS